MFELDFTTLGREITELFALSFLQGENEKEKLSGESKTTRATTESSQQEAATPTSTSATNPPIGGSPWATNPMGYPPQYYAGYQSAYPYYAMGYPTYNPVNSHLLTSQGYASYPTSSVNQNALSTIQAQTVSNQSNRTTWNDSGSNSVRQRTAASQTGVGQNIVQAAANVRSTSQNNSASVMDTQPHITQSGMFSLVVLWFIAVSIIALICRRIFVVS